jgi:hypothetical protein
LRHQGQALYVLPLHRTALRATVHARRMLPVRAAGQRAQLHVNRALRGRGRRLLHRQAREQHVLLLRWTVLPARVRVQLRHRRQTLQRKLLQMLQMLQRIMELTRTSKNW